MKKWLAVLLCGLAVLLCTAALADVTINETNFPDIYFRGFVQQKFDLDKNGVLDDAEIKAVTSITIENKETKNLTGIGFFENLRELDCAQCKMVTLDLSKNTTLTKLVSNQCENLTNISVRGCTSLLYLFSAHCKLTSLDLSDNKKLQQLSCSNNQLKKLDLMHNIDLIYLGCDHNQLKKLDLSFNTNLTYLCCTENKLTKLDLTHNTELTDLLCGHNKLKKLDISHIKDLEVLICDANKISDLRVDKNLALNFLACSDNQIKSLNIKNNVKLEELHCEHNHLKSLDLQHNPKLINILQSTDMTKKGGIKCFGDYILSIDDDVELLAPVAFINNLRYIFKGKEAEICRNDDLTGKKLIIPDTVKYKGKTYEVTVIRDMASINRKNLTELIIGKNVRKIGKYAFMFCDKLKKITIKTTKLTKKTIGSNSFNGIYKKVVFICPASKLKDYKNWLVKVGGAPETCTFRE